MKTLSIVLKAIWLYMAGLFSVILVYCLLIGVDQGIDVLVQCGEFFWGPGTFVLIAVVLWSYFVFYSSRILSYVKQQKQHNTKNANPISTPLHKHFPRIISFNCYVCLQAGIMSLPTTYNCNGYYLLGFIAFHNLLYFLMSDWLENKNKKSSLIGIILIAGYLLLFVFLPLKEIDPELKLNKKFYHQGSLMLLFGILFVLEFLWILFLVARRKKVNVNKALPLLPEEGFYERIMHIIGFRQDFIAAEKMYLKWFTSVSVIAFFIYLAGINSIIVAANIGSLAYVLLALGILVCVSSFVSFFSIRWSVNLFLLLLLWSYIMGILRDPYQVRTIDAQKDFSYNERPEAKVYLEKWFKQRIKLMKEDSVYKNENVKFDTYIVLSNGGASRAGYWSGYSMSRLQDISYAKDPKNSFKEHLLCLAGASGGTVGTTSFYALLKAKHDKIIKEESFTDYSTSFYRKDFLVFAIAHLLGPDLLQQLVPIIFLDDRGDAVERSLCEAKMEYSANLKNDTLLKWYYKKPLSEVFDQSGDLPVLYMNSTEVANGGPALMSNVKLASEEFTTRRTDMLELVDSLKAKRTQRLDIRLGTAAILSSRFPYLSPAAKIHNRYFVDGGYFDNSGAGTIFEFTQQLTTFLNSKRKDPDSLYYKRFTFHILHFNNSELKDKPIKDINPVTNDLASPFLTLVGVQGSNTSTTDGVLGDYFEDQFSRWEQRPMNKSRRAIEYNLYEDAEKYTKRTGGDEEIFPMSWVLSEYQMARMRKAFKRENNENMKKFYFMNLK